MKFAHFNASVNKFGINASYNVGASGVGNIS